MDRAPSFNNLRGGALYLYELNTCTLKSSNMKKIYSCFSLFSIFLLMHVSLYGAVISFENADVPAEWSVLKGSIFTSSDKAKLGTKSLCWSWTGGDILSAVNPDGLSTYSSLSGGGITLWVYNTVASNSSIKFSFYNSANQEKCNFLYKLNFVGWRCIWAQFGWDIKHDMSVLSTMKISAPDSGTGTLFFDFLEFKSIQWDKMANAQYLVGQSEGVTNYWTVRNTKPFPAVAPTEEQKNAFNIIANRMDQWYLGNDNNINNSVYAKRALAFNSYVQRGVKNFNNIPLTSGINNTINGPGLFPMDFHGKTIDGVQLTSFRSVSENYLIQLAYNFRKNGDVSSKDNALKIFDWCYDQGWADGSALGTLRFEMLRSAGFFHSAFLLRNQLSDEQFNRVFGAVNWHALCGMLYQDEQQDGELADYIRTLAYPKLCYALTLKDEAQRNTALNACKRYFDNALKVAPGFLGTLKPDGSGYHHHAPYYSAYYPDVLYAGCLIYYLLHDTPYALSQESFQNLKKGLLTFRFFCGEYNVPTSTCGRFPTQNEVLHQLMPAFAYLILSDQNPDQELLAAFKRSWNPENELIDKYVSKAQTDICFSSTLGEVDALVEASKLTTVLAEDNPVGTKYMPYSGLLIARQKNWLVSIKGFSQYIWDFESSSTENIYGRYLSYGHIEYSDLVNHYRSFDIKSDLGASWDWRMIPGTTGKVLSAANFDFNKLQKHRNFSSSTFLGGIGFDDRCAIFTNRLHDNTFDNSFYADKSVFVFDNVFYCMGSGIKSRSTTVPFNTTLFQNKLSANPFYLNGSEILSNVEKVSNATVKDNFGNTYIVNDGLLSVKKGTNYCLAYIDHGTVVDNAKYGYTWLIQADEKQVNEYKLSSPIQILEQDATAHAVYHAGEKILAASVFEANTILSLMQLREVSVPMIVMMKESSDGLYDLAFSNPDMDRDIGYPSFPASNNDVNESKAAVPGTISTISLKLNGVFQKADMNNAVNVTSENGITTVSYDSSKDGETYRVSLKAVSPGTSIVDCANDSSASLQWNVDALSVCFPYSCLHVVQLIDLNGRILTSKKADSLETTFDMKLFGKGTYFIRVTTDNKEQMFKVFKK